MCFSFKIKKKVSKGSPLNIVETPDPESFQKAFSV